MPQERQLPRTARVLTLGSCFADSIGERLRQNKVPVLANPFGTVFQPLALAQLLRAAAGEEQDWQQHVVEARGRWQSFDFHGTVGADSPVDLLQLIQQKVAQVGEFLKQTDLVVLTLGTAWAYRLRETDELVSNLHKLPGSLFAKELLTADEVVNALAEVHALLRRLRPDVRIVLTVSPVRHLKDTLPLNAVSKSVLRVACHYLSELLPGVSYFPAFELLNDDLRDYRFYGADMLHPSEVAEDYVWDKFARAYFDADFGRFRKEWAAVRQALAHRPLHEGAPEHRAFLDQTRERLERLLAQGAEVKPELRDVERRLAALPPPRPVRAPEPELEDDGEERIDIGGDEPVSAGPVADAAAERTREGRGRSRRGRGRDRGNRTPPPVLPAPTEEPEMVELEPTHEAALAYDALDAELLTEVAAEKAAELASQQEPTPAVAPEEAVSTEESEAYPAKKKKRRSRGGAKRTARKHAARLAAEQQVLAETATAASIEPLVDALEFLPASAPATPEETATLPAVEAAKDVTTEAAATEIEAPLISTPADENTTAAAALELTTLPDEDAQRSPAPRRRGTGPAPKKSSVITKSSPVKRSKRAPLFRNAAAVEPAPPATVEAQAPIISTPIVPETLLERPAIPELLETPAATVASEPATPALAKPKRGRPKKAAESPANATTPPVAEVPTVPAATAAPEAVADQSPAVASPDGEEAAAKPARARRPPKPKAAGDTTSTPRRGRPPGSKKASPTA